MSKKWSMKKQIEVYSKTNFRCAYCGKALNFENNGLGTLEYAIDHIYPKSMGGSNNISNLFGSCRTCNSSKKNKTLERFRFVETCKQNNVPVFSEEQLEYLKTKVDISKIFPEQIKFYFEKIQK